MLFLYALTIFLGAALLFVSELMFGRLILPLLGGTPAVWNTCMVYFQFALLAGYGYAHLTSTKLKIRGQLLTHILVLAMPLLLLPIAIPHTWRPPAAANPIPWMLLMMTATIGAPFVLVSATAPILQRWFTHSDHPAAKDPYFLYAASNAGSFVGLIGYITIIEPHLSLRQQSLYWKYGYYCLLVLIVLCAVTLIRGLKRRESAMEIEKTPPRQTPAMESKQIEDRPITPSRLAYWVLLAAIPSSLMLGLTTYLTTDVAAMPLLWVIPLSLYLLSFIIAFSKKALIPNNYLIAAVPILVVLQTIVLLPSVIPQEWVYALHMTTFFIIAVACHRQLQIDRPAAKDLTKFYLTLSIGGVVGGMFNALLAPVIFSSTIEYPLVLAVATVVFLQKLALFRSIAKRSVVSAENHKKKRKKATKAAQQYTSETLPVAAPEESRRSPSNVSYFDAFYVVGFLGLFFLHHMMMSKSDHPLESFEIMVYQSIIAAACYAAYKRPIRLGICLAIVIILPAVLPGFTGSLYQGRNFFGVSRVDFDPGLHLTTLVHGTTRHGSQFRPEEYRRIPLSYYFPTGPIGDVFKSFLGTGVRKNVGIIGLGAGTIATYGQSGDKFTYYEINPMVEKIASDKQYFTYLSDARARGVGLKVILGDGRLTIQDAPDQSYDLIILDAFSSDSIPVHLLTKEAMEVYMSKLTNNGIIACNITNHYMNLLPVVGNIANATGLTAYYREDMILTPQEVQSQKRQSLWVVIANRKSDLGKIVDDPQRWQPLNPDSSMRTWTDDYSNVLQVILRRYQQ